jgi:hypothetical protein
MPFSLILSLLPAFFSMGVVAQSDRVSTLVVHEEVIMRVPVRPFPRAFNWDEKKGPKCIPAGAIRGAMLSGREHVDFMLIDRTRMRARLSEDCPALDFYNGFYLTPEDGKICARQDEIHSRMGSSCRIEKFHRLVPRLSR